MAWGFEDGTTGEGVCSEGDALANWGAGVPPRVWVVGGELKNLNPGMEELCDCAADRRASGR